METEPRLNASRPTIRRAGGFLLVVTGAALMGVGAISTWLTVGIPNESAHSVFPGTDLIEGRVVLACALVALVAVVATRLVRSRRARYALAGITAAAGLVGAVAAASFIRYGKDRSTVLAAIGIRRELWAQFGVFRDFGAGAFVALAGGALCLAGAILTISWARRVERATAYPSEVSGGTPSG